MDFGGRFLLLVLVKAPAINHTSLPIDGHVEARWCVRTRVSVCVDVCVCTHNRNSRGGARKYLSIRAPGCG